MAGDNVSEPKDANVSGIPKTTFVDNVDEFMKLPENAEAETVLKRLEEQHQKYKFMEYNLVTKKSRLKAQIPDIKTSLDIVKHMKSKKGAATEEQMHYQLSDTLYAIAKIPYTEKVCLWLGANVMLEYNLDDADALLTQNLEAARKSLGSVDEDVGYLRDQTTTIEVNMARVYNWDVKRRQGEGAKSS